jgi:glycosyltransferase involved in cell wall biosynthesis
MVQRPAPHRVLWVTEEPPDRSLGGGNIRQAHLFEALARRFPTDLMMVGPLDDDRVREAANGVKLLRRRDAPWSLNPLARRALELTIILASPYPSAMYPTFLSRRSLAHALRAVAGSYAAVYIEHEALVPLHRVLPDVPKVVTFQHLVSQMIEQELAQPSGPRQTWFRTRDLMKAQRLEREALRCYEHVITCSTEDAAALRSLGESSLAKIAVIPNGVDLSAFSETSLPQQPRVLFPGSLAYGPNVDGAVWFVDSIWPLIRKACPEAELRLAGREPVAQVRALARVPGVTVHANVPSMVEQFEWARTVVVPLRIGTGTRLKALEAMAATRPVVGTSIGLGGIGLVDGVHACVRDDPDAFARAVVEVLGDDTRSERLAQAARTHVESRFGWDQVGGQLVEFIREMVESGQSPEGPSTAAR